MTLKYALKNSFQALEANKSRSGLTILGIVIGITSIILVMSIGSGAQSLILKQVGGIGANTIAVLPGKQPKGFTDIASTFASNSLQQKDLDALSQPGNAPSVKGVMPAVVGAENLSYGSNAYQTTVLGGTPLAQDILNVEPSSGYFFTDEDVKSRAQVVVLGSKVKDQLFGPSDAVGEKIKIKGLNFRVAGVLPKEGQSGAFNLDDVVLVPYTTAQEYITGTRYFNRFIIEAVSASAVPVAVEEITQTLRNSHNITDPSKDDFFVQTEAQIASTLSTVTSVLTLFLVMVAGISLLVGGVGIMNIMLVTVTERTKEIGLRKAVGATNKDILQQFLSEAVMLTGIGGIIGIIIGSGMGFLASVVLSKVLAQAWIFSFPFGAAFIGLIVSSTIGLIFGLYPALEAAKKNPIEALRYE